jgi:uncharacterized protein involved in cysteine biosynthesis
MFETKPVLVRIVVVSLLIAIALAGAFERFAVQAFLDW